ncbi:ImmA/IrrE family metallo-endopeptidase [Paradevosia shaoguanensis]|uniref:ImmA/IrrE family metallo-endopeptidase n=1 Tax=Paradevosia shaoguanensis TaxID=1335043 RepID=UPI003C7428B9
MDEFNADRLIWARKRSGLNQIGLARAIDVDPRAVRAWETKEYEPTEENLNRLSRALELPVKYFFKAPLAGPEPSQASFRSLSKMSATKRDMALARGAFAFELSKWLESHFDLPSPDLPDLGKGLDPETAALALRQYWGLGLRPISNAVHLLEAKGVRVFSLSIDAREVDAFSIWNDDNPFVFLNTKKSSAHSRFDAAHELGHLVMHRHGDYDGRTSEKEANDFASAFLMPREDILAAAPRFPTVQNILQAKKRWGVSAAALTVRLYKVGILSDWQYHSLFKKLSQLGLRSNEINDEARETSKIFEICLSDLLKQGITLEKISTAISFSVSDIQELLFNLAVFSIKGDSKTTTPQGKRPDLRLVVSNDE